VSSREWEYARSMLPSVWSSLSNVIVAAFGILLSGSRRTLRRWESVQMWMSTSSCLLGEWRAQTDPERSWRWDEGYRNSRLNQSTFCRAVIFIL
jgi:hypothetical protein